MKYKLILLIGLVFSILVSLSFVSAWDFYGYVYDTNRNALNNSLVNITFWTISGGPPTLVGSNSTTSNALGWFNISNVHQDVSYFYKPVITHTNSTTSAIDYVGQSLPHFPFAEFNSTTDINFYLRNAGTINITAINSSGGRTIFQYQVKDTKLGYPIADNFGSYVSEAIIYVPRDRNYSVMVYPNQSLPVSFDWNNFSSNSSYEFGQEYPTTNLSSYNVTTHTVHKQFNCTESLIRVTGYINATGINGWNEFTIVPFLLEPGNMIYLSNDVGMPYNMSAWIANGSGVRGLQSDEYNLTSGWYNITLPGPAESATYILFATARNGSNYHGSFRNITLNYSSSDENGFNFTMYGLLGEGGTANSNITLKEATNWTDINISTAKQKFNLVNESNVTLVNITVYLEIALDYSDYNCTEFTFTTDISSGDASFYIPLINVTGVKEINIFAMSGPPEEEEDEDGGAYAPKRVSMSVDEIQANNNITLRVWSPEGLGGTLSEEDIFIKFYISNSSCDVPTPADGCQIGDFGPDATEARENFSPLSVIIGGGKLSFRMGYGDIEIHYVNVDMLASGPPDVSFDDVATTSVGASTGDAFSSALRFGSMGPTIYDYVLVSIPYIQGSSSATGLNENADVNMSIPLFYTGDDVDTLIWNTDDNGTSAAALAGNYSHYSAYQSEWGILMNQSTCTTNVSEFNSTNPCYLDTNHNQIWIRIPHFDGNEPSISGRVITADEDVDEDGNGGGGTGTAPFWTSTYVYDDKEFSEQESLTKELSVKHRIRIKINGTSHYVGVADLTSTTATINVSSDPQQAIFNIGDEKKFDVAEDGYYDLNIKLNSIESSKANITIKSVYEEIPECIPDWDCTEWSDCIGGEKTRTCTDSNNCETDEGKPSESEACGMEAVKKNLWLWVLIAVVVVLILVGIGYGVKKRKG